MEPKEVIALLTWLQEHEAEITNDALANMTREAESEDQRACSIRMMNLPSESEQSNGPLTHSGSMNQWQP